VRIDFPTLEERLVEGMRGGQGSARMKQFADPDNRVLWIALAPGASIGGHRHETSSETVYVLSGRGTVTTETGEEQVAPGDCHYCPKGAWHSLANTGDGDLEIFAVIPEHGR